MFETLKEQPADKILMLMQAFKEDPREDKIDLGVGVYKDASGNTPVMRAVKAAERKLVEEQTTKSYVGLPGDPAFGDAMVALVLGDAVARDQVSAAATPGGTGAVRSPRGRVRADHLRRVRPDRDDHAPGGAVLLGSGIEDVPVTTARQVGSSKRREPGQVRKIGVTNP